MHFIVEKSNKLLPHFYYGYIVDYMDEKLLNGYEANIYHLLKSDKRKREWLGARVCAKKMISSFLKIDLSDITIKNDENGKPYAVIGSEGKSFYISLSHRMEIVGCAFNVDLSPYVGFDIEVIGSVNKKYLGDFMSESEMSFSDEKVIEIWSVKEAVVKMIGVGLKADLKDIEYESGRFIIKNLLADVLESLKIGKIYYTNFTKDKYILSLCWVGG